ncbi:MAG: hypothetical protein Q4Q17_05845, partial [Tissierellia bacterium]|nr:hypothetical protein [Tissierellia bacterium]
LVLLTCGLVFGLITFKNSPKKIAATAIYHLDNRMIEKVDRFFPNMGIIDMADKLEREGNFTLSLIGSRYHNYYQEWINLVYITNPENGEKELSYRFHQGDRKYGFSQKIIKNNVYTYLPNAFERPFYIDTNTMGSFSNQSPAAKDLPWDFKNSNLFAPPLSSLQWKRQLKKTVAKEWKEILATTKVKNISDHQLAIILEGDKVANLLKASHQFILDHKNPLYDDFLKLDEIFIKNIEELEQKDQVILTMKVDSEGHLLDLFGEGDKYFFSMDEGIRLRIPKFQLEVHDRSMEGQSVAEGTLNGRDFILIYEKEKPRIVTITSKNTTVINFPLFEKGQAFQMVFQFEGPRPPWKDLRIHFYTKGAEIKPQGDFVEILKLSEEDWKKMRQEAIDRGTFTFREK